MRVPFSHARQCRAFLPYGKWTRADGVEVYFNRGHTPFAIYNENGVFGCRDSRVEHTHEVHFWTDWESPRRSRETFEWCLDLLEGMGLDPFEMYLRANPLKPSQTIQVTQEHRLVCRLLSGQSHCTCQPRLTVALPVKPQAPSKPIAITRLGVIDPTEIPERVHFEGIRGVQSFATDETGVAA